MKKIKTHLSIWRLLPSLGLILVPPSILAQEDDDEAVSEEIYEITPFVVQEGSETGYVATQTLAGTRLRSSLQDIGASVQVLTTEFLDGLCGRRTRRRASRSVLPTSWPGRYYGTRSS